MKKFLCLFLAVVLLASLCGCFGGNGTDDVRGDIASGSPSQNENENEPEFSLGKATNNTYNNASSAYKRMITEYTSALTEVSNIIKSFPKTLY